MENRPNKPFSLTFDEQVPEPYYNGVVFVPGSSAITPAIPINYPLVKIKNIRVSFSCSEYFPDCFFVIRVNFDGVAMHGDKNILLSGNPVNGLLSVDCDLLLSPTDALLLSQTLEMNTFCIVNPALTVSLKTLAAPAGDVSFFVTITGEYVDI